MAWWPRQTPSIGTVGPSRWISSTQMPAFSGRDGPGEMTMPSGSMAAMASTVISSLRTTSTSAPSISWYRF